MTISNAQAGATLASATSQSSPLAMRIIGAVALAHLINDLIQAVLPSIYPMLKASYGLTFTQVGLITLTFQLTASLLQPWVGYYTDRHPKPWLLPAGTVCTLIGILMMSMVGNFPLILLAAGLIGIGSSTFHPEASRVARLASGGRFGLAQSTFQVGGNAGSAFGPLLAAAIIIPYGQGNVAWFGLFAVFALFVLYRISRWYANHLVSVQPSHLPNSRIKDDGVRVFLSGRDSPYRRDFHAPTKLLPQTVQGPGCSGVPATWCDRLQRCHQPRHQRQRYSQVAAALPRSATSGVAGVRAIEGHA